MGDMLWWEELPITFSSHLELESLFSCHFLDQSAMQLCYAGKLLKYFTLGLGQHRYYMYQRIAADGNKYNIIVLFTIGLIFFMIVKYTQKNP